MSSDPIIINRNIVKQTAFTSFRVEKRSHVPRDLLTYERSFQSLHYAKTGVITS